MDQQEQNLEENENKPLVNEVESPTTALEEGEAQQTESTPVAPPATNPEENKESSSEASDTDEDEKEKEKEKEPKNSAALTSLIAERLILVVDEPGHRRDETVHIIEQILINAVIDVADSPEQGQQKMDATGYDTYVVNFLMPGFGASPFVKAITNHPERPLLMGFAADKMSDAYDPKKGIKIKPLRKLFEIENFTVSSEEESDSEEEEEE